MLTNALHMCTAILLVTELLNISNIGWVMVFTPSAIAILINILILIVSLILVKVFKLY